MPEQLAAAGLVELALVHPLLEDVKLRLAHHAVQAEQEPVVVVGRVVEPVGVGQQHAEAGAQLQQLVPVLARAGQPAHLQAEDQPDVVEGDLGQQPLEPGPALDRLAALAQVVVDDGDAVAGPAEGDGAVGQGVLAGGRLLVVDDLLGRGLADVDDGRAVEVPGPELGRAEGVTHGRPPCGAWPRGAGRGAGRAGRGVAAAGRPGGGPRPVGGSSAGRESVVRGGGERCVGRWRACGSSGGFGQALPAPRGQLEQRRHVDGNRSAGCRPNAERRRRPDERVRRRQHHHGLPRLVPGPLRPHPRQGARGVTLTSDGSFTGGSELHTGQLFFDETITARSARLSPYSTNTVTRTTLAQDSIYDDGGAASGLLTLTALGSTPRPATPAP